MKRGPVSNELTGPFALEVSDNTPVEAISVGVDLSHSYIGDLIIRLEPPATTGVAPVTLHDRAGGSGNAIKAVYDKASVAALGAFAGKPCNGTWTLRLRDAAAQDSGTLRSFSLRLSFVHQERMVAAVPDAAITPARMKPERRRAKAKAA
jgi:subtilisin-like proprotein convertase family protein